MRNKREYEICLAISQYMKLKYRGVIFRFDMAGLNLSKAQSGMNKMIQYGMGYPDFFLANPTSRYHGLFMEIKKENTNLYKKDDITFCTDHLKEQNDMLISLRLRGYQAQFAIGSLACFQIIDNYMNNL